MKTQTVLRNTFGLLGIFIVTLLFLLSPQTALAQKEKVVELKKEVSKFTSETKTLTPSIVFASRTNALNGGSPWKLSLVFSSTRDSLFMEVCHSSQLSPLGIAVFSLKFSDGTYLHKKIAVDQYSRGQNAFGWEQMTTVFSLTPDELKKFASTSVIMTSTTFANSNEKELEEDVSKNKTESLKAGAYALLAHTATSLTAKL